jgi:two-component system sensor histidine kinase HydH
MARKERLKSRRIVYASPLIFGAACVLLTLIITVFAVNNFQREKKLMGVALTQEGKAILSLVSSGSRDVLRRGMMRGEISRENWLQAIQQVVENSSEHSGIISLYLVDNQGSILAHGDPGHIGDTVSSGTLIFLQTIKPGSRREVSRIAEMDEGDNQLFQIARSFQPLAMRDGLPPHMRDMARGRMGWKSPEQRITPDQGGFAEETDRHPLYLVADLDLNDFSAVVSKQLIQLVILSIILLLVGIGGILSLLMLQGLRITQSRLKKMGEFTDVLISSLPVGLIAISYDGQIRTCNQSARIMFGLESDNVEGLPFEAVIPQHILSLLSLKERDRLPALFEIKLPEESGNGRSLHITIIDIEDDDHIHSGKMLLLQDLSQLKKLEMQLQRTERDAAIGRMAGGVAHELRNPLSSIKGLTLLLKSRFTQNSSDRETADLLVEEVERLDRSIGELLDYARPANLDMQALPIDDLVKKAVTLIRADADSLGIVIDETYHCTEMSVAADPDKMIQVILNLCLNSLQAMENGGLMSVTTAQLQNTVTIVIKDSGSGIGKENLSKIFDPYFTTKSGGTGLGLAISAKIMQDHNGTISLSSQAHQGTTVTVTIPLH